MNLNPNLMMVIPKNSAIYYCKTLASYSLSNKGKVNRYTEAPYKVYPSQFSLDNL